MRFSERNGYVSIRNIIQKDSINTNLKNKLWNIIGLFIFQMYAKTIRTVRSNLISGSNLDEFISTLFHSYFKQRTDQIPSHIETAIDQIDKLFFQKYKWYEIYDLLEYFISTYPFIEQKKDFIFKLNQVLEEENSAYRIIDEQVIEITSEQEIQSIEEALENTNIYSGVQQHLNQALQLMSDRQNPDYRNSIKESISAVESICKVVTADDKASLGQALKIIETRYGLHEALKKSLSQLYGYTSDGDGIRHALIEESNLTYIDAKFMLVACTNFINYLIEKTKD